MSRLIIKGLPKHYTDANVRELFSFAGELTDARVVRTKDGRSRQFGFVGFRTRQAAAAARKALDATYVGTARVAVELARAVGDDQLPRPWSKYTEGSSRYNAKHNNEGKGDGSNEGEWKRQKQKERKSSGSEKAHGNDDVKKVNDARMDEFVEVSRGRKAVPVWADGGVSKVENSTLVPSRKTGAEGKMLERKHVTFQDSDDEEDELYEDLPGKVAASGSRDDETENDEGNTTALDQTVSDMDYFKSKVVSPDSAEDGDGNSNSDSPHQKEVKEAADSGLDGDHNDQSDPGPDTQSASDSDDGTDGSDDTDYTDDTKGNSSTKATMAKQANRPGEKVKQTKPGEPEKKKFLSDGVDAGETGRLLIRNLAFSATEEEVESAFEPFGTLADVHIVKDGKGGRSRGIGFIQYMIPENAAKAMVQLDGTFLSGRILHVLPAKPRPTVVFDMAAMRKSTKLGSSSFKTEREASQKEAAHLGKDSAAQHAMHLSSDAVAEIAAQQHGVSKADLLGTEKGESGIAAVRLAMAEASIQQETRQYLLSQGIDLAKAVESSKELGANTSSAKRKRMSRVAFLAKNLPAGTTQASLEKVFGRLGKINRLVVVPSGLLAVVEYATASDAKRAYNGLAYTKFRDTPLYLEWLPSSALTEPQHTDRDQEPTKDEGAPHAPPTEKKSDLTATNGGDADRQSGTVYVKNLNFDTRDKELKEHFVKALRKRRKIASSLRSAKVAMKRGKEGNESEKLSMGFGFLEFATPQDAIEAVKLAQNTTLGGHVLELKMSNRIEETDSRKNTKRKKASSTGKPCSKLIIRNVAFEATRKDIRRLFGVFGQLKVVRLPRKMDGSHRGFAFVEFVSKGEAKSAMEALTSSHLYGRHLVIEYADENEDQPRSIAELQEKTAAYMSKKRIRRNDGSAVPPLDEEPTGAEDVQQDDELQDALYG